MDIEVKKPTQDELDNLNVTNWPIWEKEPSSFDWSYDQKESCYILEGSVDVKLPDGSTVKIEKGDFVVFPQGLSCHWNIHEKIKKHYSFG